MTDIGIGIGSPVLAPRRRFMLLRRLLAHRSFQIGAVLLILLTAAAILAPLTGIDPSSMKVRFRYKPPSAMFPFGSDNFGRDVLTRVLYGARVSLWIGFVVAALPASPARSSVSSPRNSAAWTHRSCVSWTR